MPNILLRQFTALSIYVFFVGFTFCDGFKLHTGRKLIWFAVFLLIAVHVFKTKNEFDLALILPAPTLLAILLGFYEKRRRR